MIQVSIKQHSNRYQMKLTGHANFSMEGEDMVCAGVSSIIFGGINALGNYNPGTEWFQIKKDRIEIKIIDTNQATKVILETIYTQLKTIEESFPENINVIIQEVE